MDIHMQQALKKVQDWYAKASDWQKDLFCTVWEVFRGFATSMDVRIKALKDASADQEKLVTHKNELNVIKWVSWTQLGYHI